MSSLELLPWDHIIPRRVIYQDFGYIHNLRSRWARLSNNHQNIQILVSLYLGSAFLSFHQLVHI